MHKIYKYTNTVNGKVYIGQTKLSLSERAQTGGSNYKECRRFYNAIRKYGWESFRGEVLADGLSQDEANDLEQMYIYLYQSTDDACGYNLSNGGENHEMSCESKRILSEKAKERYRVCSNNPMFRRTHSEQAKKKMSDAKIGALNPMYGKTWSQRQREMCGTKGKKLNISAERRDEMSKWGTILGRARAKAIHCVEDDITFASVTEAAGHYNVNPATLCGQLRGRQHTCRGKHFEYVS